MNKLSGETSLQQIGQTLCLYQSGYFDKNSVCFGREIKNITSFLSYQEHKGAKIIIALNKLAFKDKNFQL